MKKKVAKEVVKDSDKSANAPAVKSGSVFEPDSNGQYPEMSVTDQWKRLVENRLDHLGLSKADLARSINCSKTALTQLFTASRKSALVVPINKARTGSWRS